MAQPKPSTRHLTRASTPWGWAVGGALLGLLMATLVFAPARWLALAIQEASQGQLVLSGARGTVWHGSAQLVLSGGANSIGSMALPGVVNWNLTPVMRGLQADIEAPCCMTQPLRAIALPGWGGGRVTFNDHSSSWPAGLLVGLGTPWNTVQAQGTLAIALQGLSLEWATGRLNLAGRVQVDAQDMASRLSTLKPMGSYRLTLTGGTVNALQLETLQGSLLLNGSGQWVGGRLRFDGVASALPERQDALSNLLNIIGRRDGARAIIKVG